MLSTLTYTSQRYQAHWDYWGRQLAGLEHVCQWRELGAGAAGDAPGSLEFDWEPAAAASLTRLAGERPLERWLGALAGWVLALGQAGGGERVVLDAPPLASSPHPGPVCLVLHPAPGLTVREWVLEVERVARGAYRHHGLPLALVRRGCGLPPEAGATRLRISQDGLHLAPEESPAGYDLDLRLNLGGGRLRYNPAVFSAEFAAAVVGLLQRALERFAEPGLELARLQWLNPAERDWLLEGCNQTRADYPHESNAVDLFERQVRATPDAVAVVFEGERLSYRELNARANRLGHYLRREYQLGPDQRVGLYLQRSTWLVVGILGVLKAGAAYAPISIDSPPARIQMILQDIAAKVVLSNRELPLDGAETPPCLRLDREFESLAAEPDSDPPPLNSPRDLIYVIYTSGSSGIPKGVLVRHQGIVRLVKNTNYVDFQPHHRVLQLSNYAFDGSTFDIFGALLNGASLYLFPQHYLLEVDKLWDFIAREGINLGLITTALFNQLVDTRPELLRQFEGVYFGGQAASPAHVNTALAYRRHPEALINLYGPTEGTNISSYFVVREAVRNSVPIGSPIANTRLYLLDARMEPVPVGLEGEIYVGGDGVARGYLNDPELSAERFVDDPFHPGGRLYRSGDIGRRRADGEVVFLGRRDAQVKIRGYRVELGEIETALTRYPQVRQACVVARASADGNQQLAAYLVAPADNAPRLEDLRGFLAEALPDYMIPAYFVRLDALPLTANGKVDSRALPPPQPIALSASSAYAAAHNQAEQVLVEVWQEVLGRQGIGVNDNYFALGGDSIKAIQVAAGLHQRGFKLDLAQLFSHPSVAELAPHLGRGGRVIDQAEVSGEAPLSPVQRWFFQHYPDTAAHFNQALLLRAAHPLHIEALRQTGAALSRQHDSLRARFSPRPDGSWSQQVAPTEDAAVGFSEFDLRAETDPAAALAARLETLHAGFDLAHGPLWQMGLFHLPDADRLALVMHHLVVDGVSWRILLQDLQAAYTQALQHRAPRLPPKTDAYARWCKGLRAYAAGAELAAQATYWRALEQVEVPPLGYDSPPPRPSLESDTAVARCALDPATTRALLGPAHQSYHTESNDLLLTGLALALHRWQGASRCVLALESHGREPVVPELELSRTVGWFTGIYPWVLETLPGVGLGEQIRHVKHSLRAIPAKGVGYGVLRYLARPAGLEFRQRPQLSFNYLGEFDNELHGGLFSLADEPVGTEIHPHAPRVHDIDLTGLVNRGRLEFNFTYSRLLWREDTMQRLAELYRQELAEIAGHCCDPR